MKKKKSAVKEKKEKGKFMRLTASALFATRPESWMNKPWSAMALPEGSVVKVIKNEPSRVTELPNEITVKAVDIIGREITGWLASNTPMRDSEKKKLYRGVVGDVRLGAWDSLRERICIQPGWNAMTWIATFGRLNIPLLHAVIRELGGKVPSTDDVDTANVRVLRLILGNKELTVSAVKASRKSADKKSSKKSSKSSKKTSVKSTKKGKSKTESHAGRTSSFAGKIIRRLVKENPRREGTRGYKSWRVIKKGMTYEDFLKAGGVRSCLAMDLKRGNVKLVPAK